jgi:hypothetical protein
MPLSHVEVLPTLLNQSFVPNASPSNTDSMRLLAPNP